MSMRDYAKRRSAVRPPQVLGASLALLFGALLISGPAAGQVPAAAGAAVATSPPDPAPGAMEAVLERQERKLKEEEDKIARAQAEIAAEAQEIAKERRALDEIRAMQGGDIAGVSARGTSGAGAPVETAPNQNSPATEVAQNTQNNQIPVAPPSAVDAVGEAPPAKEVDASVLPQGINILTAPGHFIVETDANYVESKNNILTFQGIELVPGVEIGAITANNTERNLSVVTESIRYGLAPRWEVQIQAPYVYENDRVTEAEQRDNQVQETSNLRGSGLGDVQITARYQLTAGQRGWPILVANVMVKPPTGTGPFDLRYDQYGDALNLPTGSGFWGVEPSISLLYTSDPAVLFANFGYLYQFSTNVDKVIGGATVGRVDPGASLDASFGFAFALNPRFSFSLGFQESYLEDTYETINGARQRAYALQIGSLLFGTSFRVTEKTTVSANFQFGVTSDAPNVTATLRVPLYF